MPDTAAKKRPAGSGWEVGPSKFSTSKTAGWRRSIGTSRSGGMTGPAIFSGMIPGRGVGNWLFITPFEKLFSRRGAEKNKE